MIETKNISEMLTSLIETYDFNKNTLSKYLVITEKEIEVACTGFRICSLIRIFIGLPVWTPRIADTKIADRHLSLSDRGKTDRIIQNVCIDVVIKGDDADIFA